MCTSTWLAIFLSAQKVAALVFSGSIILHSMAHALFIHILYVCVCVSVPWKDARTWEITHPVILEMKEHTRQLCTLMLYWWFVWQRTFSYCAVTEIEYVHFFWCREQQANRMAAFKHSFKTATSDNENILFTMKRITAERNVRDMIVKLRLTRVLAASVSGRFFAIVTEHFSRIIKQTIATTKWQ